MNTIASAKAIVAAIAFGACGPAAAQDSARLFEQRCAKCHAFEKIAPDLAKRDAADRLAFLEKLLQKHFPPPPAERKPLAEYLAKRAGK